MSFGWSGSDVFLLVQLAWKIIENTRKACGEYKELARETLRLHTVLQRLEQEVAKPESPINQPGESSKEQLERIASDCEDVLKQLDKTVTKYASLGERKRSVRTAWQKMRFGNSHMADLGHLRSILTLYTSEMLFYLNLISMSTAGRIEEQMKEDKGVLREIKIAVEKKTAHTVLGGDQEGSGLTDYVDHDTRFWRSLRRDLINDGLPSSVIHKHKHLIKEYVKELGARGVLDDPASKETSHPQHDIHADPETTKEIKELPGTEDDDGTSSQSTSSSVDVSDNRKSDCSTSSRSKSHCSTTHQPLLRVKHTSMRRSEPMPVDRIRPRNAGPLEISSSDHQPSPKLKQPSIRRPQRRHQ